MDEFRARMAADLAEIEQMRMPFGKFSGVPIYDLPAEYLQYFSIRGFSKGRLGELLKMVYQMKADGADCAFDEMRRRAGGRTALRRKKRPFEREF